MAAALSTVLEVTSLRSCGVEKFKPDRIFTGEGCTLRTDRALVGPPPWRCVRRRFLPLCLLDDQRVANSSGAG